MVKCGKDKNMRTPENTSETKDFTQSGETVSGEFTPSHPELTISSKKV